MEPIVKQEIMEPLLHPNNDRQENDKDFVTENFLVKTEIESIVKQEPDENLPFETGNSIMKSEVMIEPVAKQKKVEPENCKTFETENFLIKSEIKFEPMIKQEVGQNSSNSLSFETEDLTLKSEIKMEPAVKEGMFDPENYKAFETGNLLIKSEIKSEPIIKQELDENASNILPFETENLDIKSELKTEPVIKQEIIKPKTDKPFEIENFSNLSTEPFIPSNDNDQQEEMQNVAKPENNPVILLPNKRKRKRQTCDTCAVNHVLTMIICKTT